MRRPLLEVESVQLAAAPSSGPPPQSQPLGLLWRAALQMVVLLGIPVIGLSIVAVLVAVMIFVDKVAGVAVGALMLSAGAVLLAMARAVVAMVRTPIEPPDEVEVPASEEPAIYDEVRRLAHAAGTRAPDRVVVVRAANAYVKENGRLLGLLRGRRTLAIGVPLFDALTVTELRAVLAHELGHFAAGDTRLGPLAYRIEAALATIVHNVDDVSGWLFRAYYKAQYRAGASIRRGQERVADRASVGVAGRQCAADALRKVAVADALDSLYLQACLGPLLRTGRRPADLASGYRTMLIEPSLVTTATGFGADEKHDPYASHPPLPDRIRQIELLPDLGQPTVDERAASTLFADPERWVQAAHERWLEVNADGKPFTVVDWSEWPQYVVQAEQERLTADVHAVLTALGLASSVAGVRQAIETGQQGQLAGGLVVRGWRAGIAGTARDFVSTALLATATMEAVWAGTHRWELSWNSPPKFRSLDGEEVQVHDYVLAALDGEWSQLAALSSDGAGRDRQPPPSVPSDEDEDHALSPLPPAPPFESMSNGCWRVVLPGATRLGRKRMLAVGPSSIDVAGKATLPYDDVVTMRLECSKQYATVGFKLTIATASGSKVTLVTSGWTKRQRTAIGLTSSYLWALFSSEVAPRRYWELAQEIQSGRTVTIGGLKLTADGASYRGGPLVEWADVVGPIEVGPDFITFSLGEKGVALSANAQDAYLLPGLVPCLRALFT